MLTCDWPNLTGVIRGEFFFFLFVEGGEKPWVLLHVYLAEKRMWGWMHLTFPGSTNLGNFRDFLKGSNIRGQYWPQKVEQHATMPLEISPHVGGGCRQLATSKPRRRTRTFAEY